MKATWHPHDDKSSDREHKQELPDSAFAFPKQRKEPMTDASHVRNAIARFDQVKGRLRSRPRTSLRQPQSRRKTLQDRHARNQPPRPRQPPSHQEQDEIARGFVRFAFEHRATMFSWQA